MQNTRLNQLTTVLSDRLGRWLRNPWRRISLLTISVLFGSFCGIVISTIAGQEAEWDVTAAFFLLLLTEAINWLTYRRKPQTRQPLWIESLNALKIGIVYSLFLLAFLLGS
ncbi:MAG: DUF565 domain-containing protein [Cyanobacteria bacterium J06592_8]